MALADPQSVTVNTVAQSMPRVETSGQSARYKKSDDSFILDVGHTTSQKSNRKRIKHLVRVTQNMVAADQFTAELTSYDMNVSFQIDRPAFGFTEAQVKYLSAGLIAKLTDAFIAQLYGGES